MSNPEPVILVQHEHIVLTLEEFNEVKRDLAAFLMSGDSRRVFVRILARIVSDNTYRAEEIIRARDALGS